MVLSQSRLCRQPTWLTTSKSRLSMAHNQSEHPDRDHCRSSRLRLPVKIVQQPQTQCISCVRFNGSPEGSSAKVVRRSAAMMRVGVRPCGLVSYQEPSSQFSKQKLNRFIRCKSAQSMLSALAVAIKDCRKLSCIMPVSTITVARWATSGCLCSRGPCILEQTHDPQQSAAGEELQALISFD